MHSIWCLQPVSDLLKEKIEMDKIILNFEVPAISTRFDILVNPEMEVGVLSRLLCKVVEEASNRSYISSGSELLYLVDNQIILNPKEPLYRYEVRNGDYLMMF